MDDYKENEEWGAEIISPLMSAAKVMWLKKLDQEKGKG